MPISGKILERLLYNAMFEVFLEKTLTSANQSGFKTGDLSIDQPFSIIHEIYISFDDGYEVRRAFLYISKAFDKLWYLGLLYKLRQKSITEATSQMS